MNVLICDPISPKGIALLKERPEFNVVVLDKKHGEAELIPLVDLAPTWTMAVLIIMRRKRATSKKNDEARALTSQSDGPATSKE